MAETIIKDITTGTDGTQIKAGLISNDSGDCQPQTDLETLQACALAHRFTGAPIFVDVSANEDEPHIVLEVLNELGVDLKAVTSVHMGSHPRSMLKVVVESGCKVTLEFWPGYPPRIRLHLLWQRQRQRRTPNRFRRINAIHA